jgi:hypothetical protein
MLVLQYRCSVSSSLNTAGNVNITVGSLSYDVRFCISSTSSVSTRLNVPAGFGVLCEVIETDVITEMDTNLSNSNATQENQDCAAICAQKDDLLHTPIA